MSAIERLPVFLRDLISTHESDPSASAELPRVARRWASRRTTPNVEPHSLFGEILDIMLAPLLLVWPLSVAITFVVARSLADGPFDRLLEDRAAVLARQVAVAPNEIRVPLAPAATELLHADDEDKVVYQVMGPGGERLVGDASLPPPHLYDFPEPGVVKIRTALFRGEEVRVAYTLVEVPVAAIEGERPVLVQVAETLGKRNRLANEIIKGVIFPQFVILPIAVGLVWFGLSRGLAPLKLLERRIQDRTNEDLSPIDPRSAPEEIVPLIESFNDLLRRLDETMRAQKRFIADAAHQIKTPLAGLQTQAELAMRESDPEELRRTLQQLSSSAARTGRMMSQLLALARAEHWGDTLGFEQLDLAAFARDVMSDWVPIALQRRIDLG
ncbi:MAG: sensor histidine kinase N-terminal domain-containing protein, partial [Burkholderiales bacterium]